MTPTPPLSVASNERSKRWSTPRATRRALWALVRSGRRRFRKDVPVIRPPGAIRIQVIEHGYLTLKLKDGGIDIDLAFQHTGVIDQVSGRKIVRSIGNDIILSDQLPGIGPIQTGLVDHHIDIGIQTLQSFLCLSGLAFADIVRGKEDLSLEITVINGVKINNADVAYSGGGQIQEGRTAQSARTDHQNTGFFQGFLPIQPEFRDDDMPRISSVLLWRKG